MVAKDIVRALAALRKPFIDHPVHCKSKDWFPKSGPAMEINIPYDQVLGVKVALDAAISSIENQVPPKYEVVVAYGPGLHCKKVLSVHSDLKLARQSYNFFQCMSNAWNKSNDIDFNARLILIDNESANIISDVFFTLNGYLPGPPHEAMV
jgi:hypothetical protein